MIFFFAGLPSHSSGNSLIGLNMVSGILEIKLSVPTSSIVTGTEEAVPDSASSSIVIRASITEGAVVDSASSSIVIIRASITEGAVIDSASTTSIVIGTSIAEGAVVDSASSLIVIIIASITEGAVID